MAGNTLFDGLLAGREADERVLMIEPGGRDWSCAEVIAESGRFASLLRAQGVQPGDRVAVQVEKSVEAIALYLATVRAGAVFLPLNSAYTRPEVGYFLDDAEPALFVCDPAREAEFAGIEGRLLTLGADGGGGLAVAAEAQPARFNNLARGPEDLAAILYTVCLR